MAKTVEDILKESGLSDDQIKALDAKVTAGLTQVLTSATTAEAAASQAREAAERAQRAQAEQYDKTIAPALDGWANEKATFEAQLAYYKTLAEKAKEGGFLPAAEPFKPPTAADPNASRDASGKFVAGANPVPGSPQFVDGLRKEISSAFSFAADAQWKYQQLYGAIMPDSPTELIREAAANHMSPVEWTAKKYKFAEKEQEKTAAAKKAEIDAAVATAVAAKDKEWAEKVGSNPDLRRVEVSKYSEMSKGVKAGQRPDPLAPMSESARDAGTRNAIRAELAVQETGRA